MRPLIAANDASANPIDIDTPGEAKVMVGITVFVIAFASVIVTSSTPALYASFALFAFGASLTLYGARQFTRAKSDVLSVADARRFDEIAEHIDLLSVVSNDAQGRDLTYGELDRIRSELTVAALSRAC